ncbi:flagellar hook-basal body complex protein [Clostridium fallax]|uniref:Flagellar basal-body rod protein FlgG n=1 Tax=Clostridium fallax TaxID=1533 RepID=A0A1M4UIF1_9CLOT|nr:flagellar hook-basal body complex protein [Clostridium fallax]SHE56516.1 flagellar basal-body rod protein FlgG [Clostridium fallax]SQB07582.1 flagellar hook-basal body protein [Clostridium fallax]
MIRSLYTAVSGLISLEAKQDVISNNMANANNGSYKAENLAIKKFDDVLIENKDKLSGNRNVKQKIGKLCLGSRIDETKIDFSPGILEETGKKTDFAIDGKGFFVVRKGDEELYTRAGSFRVDPRGELITANGEEVLGRNLTTGAVEPIAVGSGEISLNGNNDVYIDGRPKYSLLTANFNDYNSLKRRGDNLYEGTNPNYNERVYVKQRILEKSNVNITKEMIDMITTMRNFESNQKVVQTIDETLNKAANEVGAVK